ncbi:MAG: lipopolysaccharide heptosyltransferase II [Candidatus Omnitrophica bacterium]|nr:lipopolysaccharide heptosyltransferase II [Candidatus Omnitrophota bacterium]
MRILLLRTDRLGDVVLATPVIRALRTNYPDSYIAMVVRPYTVDVVKSNPDLNEVIIYDKENEHKGLFATLKFALSLKNKKFDIALALHPETRAHIIMFAAGIKKRVGYDRKLKELLTLKIPHVKQKGLMHEAEYNMDMLKRAGFEISGAAYRPYMRTEDVERKLVDTLLKENKVSRDFVAIHVGASCSSKRWPAERFAETAEYITSKLGFDVILVGDAGTVPLNKKIVEKTAKKIYDFSDMLRVGELAELLKRAKLFISNDSGPVHVAVAVGTPVISIFGRKDPGLSPKRWGPLGARDIVLHKDAGCQKCLAHNCVKGFACLELITVQDVIRAAEDILT